MVRRIEVKDMSKVIIRSDTTPFPITVMGDYAGICWESESTPEKNYQRGLNCVESDHGRVMELPQIYMILDGYSARVIREYYTHIGGSPTRLQSSTRYIDYEHGFDYIIPSSISANKRAKIAFETAMGNIEVTLKELDRLGIPREDSAMLLPLGMTTKVVVRTNLRNLVDMSRQRMCSRAYWEFRKLMNDIVEALSEYSDEWKTLVEMTFMPKCEEYSYCTEKNSCGRKPKKEE